MEKLKRIKRIRYNKALIYENYELIILIYYFIAEKTLTSMKFQQKEKTRLNSIRQIVIFEMTKLDDTNATQWKYVIS